MGDADNIFWGPLELLRNLVAASSTFQTWVGAEDAAAAKASIYLVSVPEVSEEDYWTTLASAQPYCILDTGDGYGLHKTAENCFRVDGDMVLAFCDAVASENADDPEAAQKAFMLQVGNTIDDMAALAGTPGYLVVADFDIVESPQRSSPEERNELGDIYWTVLQITRGL